MGNLAGTVERIILVKLKKKNFLSNYFGGDKISFRKDNENFASDIEVMEIR